MTVNKHSPVPAYYQVKMNILKQIESEIWKKGDKLPTDKEFCEIFNVSRITIRRALMDLEIDGYIHKIQGKGTFVKLKEFKQSLTSFYSFTNEIAKMGHTPSAVFLNLKTVEANKEVSESLRIDFCEPVYLLERLRLADEIIIAYDRSFMPIEYFPNFIENYKPNSSLYKTFQDFYNIYPNKADETLEAIAINKEDAVKMTVPAYSPQLLVKRIAYSGSRIVEFNYRIVNSSMYKYKITLE